MLSAITWNQFLTFLFCLVALYYLAYLTIRYSGKVTQALRTKKQEPGVVNFTAGETTDDLREPLKPVPTPKGLIHEIKLHLQQIAPFEFTRNETILSVKKVIQDHKQEKDDMGKEAFMGQTQRSFYMMCSITLTPEELNELWEVQAN